MAFNQQSPIGNRQWPLLVAMTLASVLGCQRPTVQQPLTRTLGGVDPGQQMEFWHELAARPVACNDEAFHGLLLYVDPNAGAADYAARTAALKQRGLLPATFDEPADRAVGRGTVAVIVANRLKVKGGLMRRALPDSPRYAIRELVAMNVFPPSSENQTFSGSEMLGIIGRVEDYERGDPSKYPARQMTPE
jgi:hypothetical protein